MSNNQSVFSVRINRGLVTERYLEAVKNKQLGDPNAEGIQKQLLTLLLKGVEKGEVDLTEIDIYETK